MSYRDLRVLGIRAAVIGVVSVVALLAPRPPRRGRRGWRPRRRARLGPRRVLGGRQARRHPGQRIPGWLRRGVVEPPHRGPLLSQLPLPPPNGRPGLAVAAVRVVPGPARQGAAGLAGEELGEVGEALAEGRELVASWASPGTGGLGCMLACGQSWLDGPQVVGHVRPVAAAGARRLVLAAAALVAGVVAGIPRGRRRQVQAVQQRALAAPGAAPLHVRPAVPPGQLQHAAPAEVCLRGRAEDAVAGGAWEGAPTSRKRRPGPKRS
mmetsp:Transcript_6695/g.18666  ORF Transcript_6695/g.18666 Transcript_6695/m.18666 type:complete len:266 (+) Transcript_6695:148-945(+)